MIGIEELWCLCFKSLLSEKHEHALPNIATIKTIQQTLVKTVSKQITSHLWYNIMPLLRLTVKQHILLTSKRVHWDCLSRLFSSKSFKAHLASSISCENEWLDVLRWFCCGERRSYFRPFFFKLRSRNDIAPEGGHPNIGTLSSKKSSYYECLCSEMLWMNDRTTWRIDRTCIFQQWTFFPQLYFGTGSRVSAGFGDVLMSRSKINKSSVSEPNIVLDLNWDTSSSTVLMYDASIIVLRSASLSKKNTVQWCGLEMLALTSTFWKAIACHCLQKTQRLAVLHAPSGRGHPWCMHEYITTNNYQRICRDCRRYNHKYHQF